MKPSNEDMKKCSQQDIAALLEAGWFPPWKKPALMSEWEQLESQARFSARNATETYVSAKLTDAPLFLVQLAARCKYHSRRRYLRIRDHVEKIRTKAMMNLLHAIFGSD